MTSHVFYQTGDADVPDSICDRNGEVVLSLCRVCGGAEGSLPTDCPGTFMTEDQQDHVYAGAIDFVGSTWVKREGAAA